MSGGGLPDARPPDPLGTLIGRLRGAGVPVGATELADALWLAERMAEAETGAGSRGEAGASDDPLPGEGEPGRPEESLTADDGRAPGPADSPQPARHLAVVRDQRVRERLVEDAQTYDAPDAEILVPMASAFPDRLSLGHALRPLQGWLPPAGPPRPRDDGPLDESRTAQASAVRDCALPVFRADPRRQARMQLLVDDSPSMGAWERTLEELRLACEQSGAFRSVTVHRLRPHPDGGVGVLCRAGGSEWLAPADGLRNRPAGPSPCCSATARAPCGDTAPPSGCSTADCARARWPSYSHCPPACGRRPCCSPNPASCGARRDPAGVSVSGRSATRLPGPERLCRSLSSRRPPPRSATGHVCCRNEPRAR